MASEADLARVLLDKARGDASALKALGDHPEVPDAIAGFHAQQAVEKLLKAVLARRGRDYPYGHDLEHLVELLETIDVTAPAALEQATALTPWAVEFRYEDPSSSETINRGESLELVNSLIAWAETLVG